MSTGVKVLKESVIRVQSQLNDWIDCVFVVNKDDEEKARDVLEKVWGQFFGKMGTVGATTIIWKIS